MFALPFCSTQKPKIFSTARIALTLLAFWLCAAVDCHAEAYSNLTLTQVGNQVRVQWQRMTYTGITDWTISVFGPGVNSSADSGDVTVSPGGGVATYQLRECVSYYNGPMACDTKTRSITVSIASDLRPASVSLNPSSLECGDTSVTVSWDGITNGRYAVESRVTNASGGWDAWSRVANDISAISTNVAVFNAGRDYQFRVSTRLTTNSDSGFTAWRDSSTITLPECAQGSEATPFNADPAMVTDGEIRDTDQVGVIGGQFRVNEAGASIYNIPLQLTPGTAGVTPEVALSYSSQSGNGLLGKGWNLSGLSAISRCRQTLMQDRQALPITWGADDRFCLNGSRLVLVDASDTYGAPGTEYKTEIDTFVTVTAVGGSTGKPDYFTLEAKDGSTTYFGGSGANSSESVVYSSSGAAQNDKVMSWNIRQFEDSVGNKIVYAYSRNSQYHRISNIYYAYGASSGYGARLTFSYQSRPDPIHRYVSGYSLNSTVRLSGIIAYNGTETRRYILNYLPVSSERHASKTSRISSIEECVGSSDCLRATQFDWGGYANAKADYQEVNYGTDARTFNFGDFDGDGVLDPIWVADDGLVRYQVRGEIYHTSLSTSGGAEIRVLDYNLDGRDDVMVYNNARKYWRVAISTPRSDVGSDGAVQWRLTYNSSVSIPFTEKQAQFLDYNGDGIVDAYYLDARRLLIYPGERSGQSVTSSTYYRFSATPITIPIPGSGLLDLENFAWGDFNGDGRVDVVFKNRTSGRYSLAVLQSNDSGTMELAHTLSSGRANITTIRAVDINGDGLTDVAWLDAGQNWAYRLSTGVDFEAEQELWAWAQDDAAQFADINGDGYNDFYFRRGSQIRYLVWLPDTKTFSSDAIFSSITTFGGNYPDVHYSLRDIDNNGMVDLIGFSGNEEFSDYEQGIRVRFSDPTQDQFITQITNGLGAETRVEYSPLNSLGKKDLYTSYEGIAVSSGQREVCQTWAIPVSGAGNYREECHWETAYSVDASEFYREVNDPYLHLPEEMQVLAPEEVAPVIELKGPVAVVSTVFSSAPVANDPDHLAGVDYRYKLNLLQAAGRGGLGFRELITTDLQSNIATRSRYRQDWPFIGQPLSTVVRTQQGHKLSESANSTKIFNWYAGMADDLADRGSEFIGALQVYTDRVRDTEYILHFEGGLQGPLLKEVVTVIEPDEYGNAVFTESTTTDAINNRFVQTTSNIYGNDTWHKKLGRLTRSEVTHEAQYLRGPVQTITRVAEFSYYGEGSGSKAGLLQAEVANVGDPRLELRTEPQYDQFGNIVYKKLIGADGIKRLTENKVFDARGRFIQASFSLFNRSVSTTDDSGSSPGYTADRTSLVGSAIATVQKTSEVSARNALGLPTKTHSYIGATSKMELESAYTPFGAQYFGADGTGNYTLSTAARGAGYHCSYDTAFFTRKRTAGGAESVTCHDMIGREIRTATIGFDGEWSYVDTQYDKLGRVAQVSDPYKTSAYGWTRFEYDLLGRTTLTVASDDSRVETQHSGIITVTINDLGQRKTQLSAGTGELLRVMNDANQYIDYRYTAHGNLNSVQIANGASTTMEYDIVGNKISMDDADKGHWEYRYNSFGELVCQQDAEGQIIVNSYDFAGRKIKRTERGAGGSCASPSGAVQSTATWKYDTATYGLGLLELEWSGLNGRTEANPDYKKVSAYDSFGRLALTRTTLRGHNNVLGDHWERVAYDQFSRPWKIWDSARRNGLFTSNGVQNVYDSAGFLYQLKDAYSANIYYEVLAVDARGNVTEDTLGGGVIRRSNQYDELTGRLLTVGATDVMNRELQFSYFGWDTLGNLRGRFETRLDLAYQYTVRAETFDYDNLNQLIEYGTASSGHSSTTTLRYDENGNITYKSDVGDYTYDYNGPHANAVKTAGGVNYNYNANGSMTRDTRGRTFTYNANDKVTRITKSGRTTEFFYDAGKARYKRVDTATNGGKTTTLYLGTVEKIHHADNTEEWRRHIGDSVMITQKFHSTGSLVANDLQYLLRDHLGSVNGITDSSGKLLEVMAFDPWGKRRESETWAPMSPSSVLANYAVTAKPFTSRGFTDHQMVDEMEIIHMKGRIYDPLLGRFLQADPHVQSPDTMASLNRYAYVWNNPLNATDPSGFFLDKLWDDVIKPLAGAIVASVLTYLFPTNTGFWWATFVGAASGAVSAGVNGSNILKGAAFGAFSAAAFYGAGEMFVGVDGNGSFFGTGLTPGDFAGKVLAHGMVGGVMSVLQGGKFGHGFAAAGVSQSFAGKINGMKSQPARVATSAAIGGTVSEMTGGKFGNGATTAAFGRLFNEGMHAAGQKGVNTENGFKVSSAIRDERVRLAQGYDELEAILSLEGGLDIASLPKNQRALILDVNSSRLDKQLLKIQLRASSGLVTSNAVDAMDLAAEAFLKPVAKGVYTFFDSINDIRTSGNYRATFSYGCSGYQCNLTGFEINDN